MVQPLPVGNALRLFIEPPAEFDRWRVLRKSTDTIASADDPSALVVHDGDERIFIDAAFLKNDERAYYRPFYSLDDGVTWVPGASAYGTPVSSYAETTTDVLGFLRDRMEAGLTEEVRRGNLVNDLGYIQVYTAAPSLERDLAFPLVTMHLEKESPSDRAIGEDIDAIGIGQDDEGWLQDVTVAVIGWSLNGDERIELRKAIRRIVLANMAVFSDKGWLLINLTAEDVDALGGEYPAPLYQAVFSFSCVAPVRVTGAPDIPTIASIIS
jgi:hypothetical protein